MTNYKSNKDGVDREMTLHEVAAEMGISYEVVRTTEIKAIRKLKKALFERCGDSVTLYDILPSLFGNGDYNEPLQSM